MRVATVALEGVARVALERDGVFWAPARPGSRWPPSMRALIEDTEQYLPALAEWNAHSPARGRLEGVNLLAPLPDPGKIVGVGRNYADHVAEAGVPLPAHPTVFAKFPSSIIGPMDPISWSLDVATQVDFEAELAVVIGTRASNLISDNALAHIFGYTCLNDISARDLQRSDGQWVRAKSLDSFCPLGPWIVTADEIPDPQDLRITCTVSGETMQSGTTGDMHFTVAELIAFISRSFALDPGDIIATGTPAGVGAFRTPPRFLRDGDWVSVTIEKIGSLENPVRVRNHSINETSAQGA